MKKYILKKGMWEKDDFYRAVSPHTKALREFIQEDDCVSNSYNEEIQGYDYISLITKKRYGEGTVIKTKCSFDHFGAPLIVFSDDVKQDNDGIMHYTLHFEVVAYEKGLNVWHIVPNPAKKDWPIDSTKIAFSEFDIPEKSIVDLSVKLGNKCIYIDINGVTMTVQCDEFPSLCHVGFTACEGVNHFYEFSVEES